MWHLQRTQVTQLVTHERIHTTLAKAKALQYLALKVFKYGKQVSEGQKRGKEGLLKGILTTDFAVDKLIKEIVPKYQNHHENIIKVVDTGRRLSDKARTAYIEYSKNDLKNYEEAAKQEKLDKGEQTITMFNKRVLQEERDLMQSKLEGAQELLERSKLEIEEQLKANKITQSKADTDLKRLQQDVRFFERKLEVVDRDIWIENKNKIDMRRYFRVY